MSISALSVKRPVAMTMVILIIVVLGTYSLTMLPIDLFPNMTLPMVVVQTSYSGAAPAEVETMVTKNIESAAAMVGGIKNISSSSSSGTSLVMAEFEVGADIDMCAMELREKIDLIKGMLPEDAGEPMVIKLDPSMMPVGTYNISIESADLERTRTFAENEIKAQLEGIEGVGTVTVTGGLSREIQIEADPSRLIGYSLSIGNITGAFATDNANLPGGDVTSGGKNISVRSMGEFTSIDDINNLPITLPTGTTLYLRDVATVEDTYEEQDAYSRLNGSDSVTISIQKQSGANTVAVMDQVNKKMAEIGKNNPDVEIATVFDQGETVKTMIYTVAQNAIIGALLAALILLFFLQDFKTTLILAISIPTSVIATFAAMYFMGITLNIVSLGGLALGVGMLVDNSIVVLENIFQCKKAGGSIKDAAIKGAVQVTGAITASTLTTVVVFLPVVFTQDITSVIFKEMALTVAFSQLCSLLITLLVVPMTASKFLSEDSSMDGEGKKKPKIFRAFSKFLDALTSKYEKIIGYALSHRKKIATWALVLFIGSFLLLPFIGMEFMPEVDSGTFTVNVEMPVGTELDTTDIAVRKAESIIKETDKIKYMSSTSEGATGSITITVEPGAKTKKIQEEIRNNLAGQIPGAEISISSSSMMSMGGGSGLTVEIVGKDFETNSKIADQLILEMSQVDGIRDAKSSLSDAGDELKLYIDREKAASYGLTTTGAASSINMAMNGHVVGTFKENGQEYNIRIKYPEAHTTTLEDIKNLKIPTPYGGLITISEIAEMSTEKGPQTLSRKNQKGAVTVTAAIYDRDLGSVSRDVQNIIDHMNMPDGYTAKVGGNYESMTSAFSGLLMALLLAVLLIYMVMAAQFESLIHPLIIMFSIPLSLIGVFFTLFISRSSLNVTALIGVIMLCGIVVNNAIVLLDYIKQNRAEYEGRMNELIAIACRRRLMPILMTTLTSLLGYLPSIISTASGSEMMKPLAWTLIGGLAFSTTLTLVFIPVIYSKVDEIMTKRKSMKTKSASIEA